MDSLQSVTIADEDPCIDDDASDLFEWDDQFTDDKELRMRSFTADTAAQLAALATNPSQDNLPQGADLDPQGRGLLVASALALWI